MPGCSSWFSTDETYTIRFSTLVSSRPVSSRGNAMHFSMGLLPNRGDAGRPTYQREPNIFKHLAPEHNVSGVLLGTVQYHCHTTVILPHCAMTLAIRLYSSYIIFNRRLGSKLSQMSSAQKQPRCEGKRKRMDEGVIRVFDVVGLSRLHS